MKISVVTISYNQSAFLYNNVTSVAESFGGAYEHVIVDGGSADGFDAVIRALSLKYRIRYISEKDNGPADALNKGIQMTTGDYIYILNADDYVFPWAGKLFNRLVANNQQNDVFYGGGIIDNINQVNLLRKYKYVYPKLWSPKCYLNGKSFIFQQSVLMRKDSIIGVKFNVNNRTCWDGEYWLQLSGLDLRWLRYFVPLAAFCIHGQSITGSAMNGEAYIRDKERILKEYGKFLNE